jgi:putative redox protein
LLGWVAAGLSRLLAKWEYCNEMTEIIVRGKADGLLQEISAGAHRLIADEPAEEGGTEKGPGPYEFLLAALGTCTSMTLGLYARRKNWQLDSVQVRLFHSQVHAEDCADCETREGFIYEIHREISLSGTLTEEQRAKLVEIANKCPVHRTLTSEIKVRTQLVDASRFSAAGHADSGQRDPDV